MAAAKAKPQFRCFVEGLAPETDVRNLIQGFCTKTPGRILEAKIVTDRKTGESKGLGFVTFATEESMNDAIEVMNGVILDGSNITVSQAKPKPARGNKKGTGHGGNKNGSSRQENGATQGQALGHGHGHGVVEVEVDGSRDGGRRRSTTDEDGYTCFVGGLWWKTDGLTLKKVFGRFGDVKRAEVKYYYDENGRKRSKGYGFVTFETEEAMLNAIKLKDGKIIDEFQVSVQKANPKQIRLNV